MASVFGTRSCDDTLEKVLCLFLDGLSSASVTFREGCDWQSQVICLSSRGKEAWELSLEFSARKGLLNGVWWHMPIILALRGLRKEDPELEASWSDTARLYFSKGW